jgi:hypothetical protein
VSACPRPGGAVGAGSCQARSCSGALEQERGPVSISISRAHPLKALRGAHSGPRGVPISGPRGVPISGPRGLPISGPKEVPISSPKGVPPHFRESVRGLLILY